MPRELANWLGPQRSRLLSGLILGGLMVVVLLIAAFSGESWLSRVIALVFWLMLAGVSWIVNSRLPDRSRPQLWRSAGPALGLLAWAVILPRQGLFFAGASVGWLVLSQFVLRSRVRMEYQAAIRHLRHNEFDQAIEVMAGLIEAEPLDPEHYRFRAELYRLSNRVSLAQSDYERMIDLVPDSSAGYMGLAEVYAQTGEFEKAYPYAVSALERDVQNWMSAYNLGMIEDRLSQAASAIEHLESALKIGLSSSRYLLLTRLWLARNFYRLGDHEAALRQLELLRNERAGLQDWHLILSSDQAAPLRGLLEPDVQLAERLLDGSAALDVFDH
ncbi:MAG TPA: tetratricopeptide repeat protein [Aggregatilineaceae bacterium]|nr:tetratricopeptide repeat protein [Aggregatilineaceae bacterium]